MSKVLVTGGAGFIGSHVSVKLLERGDEVVIIDDFNDRYDPRLKEARIDNLFNESPAPVVVRGDIRDRDIIESLFKEHKFDQIIHLAAWASILPSLKNPYIYTAVNVDGTVNILEEARKNGVKNIVYAGTSSVYGSLSEMPFREDMNVSRPDSPYSATKLAGEIMCATWFNLYQIPMNVVRFFTVYGPWGRPEMSVFKFTKAILEDTTIEMRGSDTKRDFTYIDDIVGGVLGALDNPKGFEVYNLGESDAVPLPRMISALEKALNKTASVKEVPLNKGELAQTLADISKARADLNYNPTTKIEEGVKKFADWYIDWYVPNLAPTLDNR